MLAHHWVFLGSSVFVLAACANSARLTRRHLRAPGPEGARTCTVRILLMVPVYSIESWLALVLRASDFNKLAALLRKGYESVVVLSFARLLLAWLGGPAVLAERLEPERCKHLPPLSFVLPSWAPAPRFLRHLLLGVFQNTVCSMFVTPLAVISWCTGGASPRVFEFAQTCCILVMNASQFFAVYCVITFYHANRGPLASLRPVQKLLSIKALVFCLFWQEAAVRVAEHAGVFDDWVAVLEHWSVQQVAWGLLNCVICVEMFVLSVVHSRVYPPGETTWLMNGMDSLSEASTSASARASGSDSDTSAAEAGGPEVATVAATAVAMAAAMEAADVELSSGHWSSSSSTAVGGDCMRRVGGCEGATDTTATIGSQVTPLAPAALSAVPPSPQARQRQASTHGFTRDPSACYSAEGPIGLSDVSDMSDPTAVLERACDPDPKKAQGKWEAFRRFLVALDVRDIPKFYEGLASLESSQPGSSPHAVAGSGAPEAEPSGLRSRPRSSTVGTAATPGDQSNVAASRPFSRAIVV